MSLTKATYSMIDGAYANVLDFGAVGDGVNDDTSAIQAAMNSVTGGGRVYIPHGVYKTTSPLTFTDGICVTGESQFNTIIDSTASIVFKTGLSTTDPLQTVVRPEIENLYIKCRGNNKTGINIAGFQYGKFSRLVIELFGNASFGIYGTAVSGASPYYNRFYEIDMSGGALPATNANIGYCFVNEFTGNPVTERRAPNANVVIGGRLQGFNVAYLDVGVGNVVIGTCFESNHNVFSYGREAGAGGVSWPPGLTGNARVYGVYLEDNTGVWFQIYQSSGNITIEPAYMTGLSGTMLIDQGLGTNFLTWGSQLESTPAIIGGFTYFKRPPKIKYTITLEGDNLVSPGIYFKNTSGGEEGFLQNNSLASSAEFLRLYNTTALETVWKISIDGEGNYANGVGGSAFTTAGRPTVAQVGTMVFDTTLGKPIWWNGSVWKDATGTTV